MSSGRFILKQTPRGFLFQMTDASGRVLATSDHRPSREETLADIDAVRREAPGAIVEDTTAAEAGT